MKLLVIGIGPYDLRAHAALSRSSNFGDGAPYEENANLERTHSLNVALQLSHVVHSEQDRDMHQSFFLSSCRLIAASVARSGSCVQITSLNASDNYFIDDDVVASIMRSLPALVTLDVRNCPSLHRPNFLLDDQFSPSAAMDSGLCRATAHDCLEKVYVDGCWRLDETLLRRYSGNLFIDLLHEPLPGQDRRLKVVIIEGRHIGNWVYCNVLSETRGRMVSSPKTGKYVNMYRSFDIFVKETLLYDHAVGYSSSPAFNISRKYLCLSNETRIDSSVVPVSEQVDTYMPL